MFKCKVIEALRRLEAKLEVLMAVAQDIKALLAQIDAATNQIATRIQQLSDRLAGGVSAEEAQEIQQQLAAEVSRLQALGADPTNPVPPTPPTP